MPLLEVANLATHFHTRRGVVRAVDGIGYTLGEGETLGIVGESGSGKSVSVYSLLGLIQCPPGRIASGSAVFQGRDLLEMGERDRRRVRGKAISIIFQDPMTALNPYMKIGRQLVEPLRLHLDLDRRAARQRALESLASVGIQDGERCMEAYPHQFSGGMRQRVMIAMALSTRPALLIADEPTTALDVTVQAQILELIKALQQEIGMAMLLITHDLGVIANTCERVAVMYAGRIMESAAVSSLFHEPRHPYTRALMASLPAAQPKGSALYTIPGMPPDLAGDLPACPFAPRCEFALERCRTEPMTLKPVAPDHETACLRVQEEGL